MLYLKGERMESMDMGNVFVEEGDHVPETRPRDRILSVLDRVEASVESLRRETMVLEERRDTLFTTLDAIRSSDLLHALDQTDRDDIQSYIERVTMRCMTVEILVKTLRDKEQEEALYQVNRLIDTLVTSFKADPLMATSRCESYLAACSSHPEVAIDKKFESALLGCTLDDQKKIKKRLQGLLQYLDQIDRISIVEN